MDEAKALVSARDITVSFTRKRGIPFFSSPSVLTAVKRVSFDLYKGETVGVVGESGSGKSTLGRAVMQLATLQEGVILWKGKTYQETQAEDSLALRRNMQVIFQDPLAALDPRMTVGDQVEEPLRTHRPDLSQGERDAAVREMLSKVGIRPELAGRYPHEFSGGQAQRIAIARALILRPQLIVCDEAVSSLDVSIQAQIISLLMELQEEFGVAFLFISHDLAVVRRICDRVLVLYLGKIMEEADRETLFSRPSHPYTRALLASVPVLDPAWARSNENFILHGELPSPLSPPSGCVFRTRCPRAQKLCAEVEPGLQGDRPGHRFACHFPYDEPLVAATEYAAGSSDAHAIER
jgi:oligopeptide transport system ATP-binding protein